MMFIYVALGGSIGAVMRYSVGLCVASMSLGDYPYSTLWINVAGSFFMGVAVGFLSKLANDSEALRVFLLICILGGFTTFSAFSYDVMDLLERGREVAALIYIISSVVLSLLAIFLGLYMVRQVISS